MRVREFRAERKPKRVPLRTSKGSVREASTDARKFPVHIRAPQVDLGAVGRDYIRRRLGRKLGKYASSIARVSVRIEDVNGPRGGVDQACRIKIVVRRCNPVFSGRPDTFDKQSTQSSGHQPLHFITGPIAQQRRAQMCKHRYASAAGVGFAQQHQRRLTALPAHQVEQLYARVDGDLVK